MLRRLKSVIWSSEQLVLALVLIANIYAGQRILEGLGYDNVSFIEGGIVQHFAVIGALAAQGRKEAGPLFQLFRNCREPHRLQ